MARMEEQLPTPSNTPSIISPQHGKPTKVDPYAIPCVNSVNRLGLSPRVEGRLLALFGAFITGLNMTAIKYLYNDKFPAPEAVITRYTPPLIFVICIGLYIKLFYSNKEWYFFYRDRYALNILSIRSFFHWCSNMSMVYSLLFVPVMVTISLFYTWTIFAIIWSHFFLNEKANIGDIILGLMGFVGVIMITDPTFESFKSLGTTHIEGIILTLVAALFYSINMVILRKKRATYHWTQTESVAGLWATFIFTPIYIIISYFLFHIPIYQLINFNLTMFEWILFVFISLFAFIAIGGITRALQLETIIIVSIVLYSEIAFGTIFQWIFLNDTTNFNTYGLWIGLLCVIISTFFIMYRKNKIQKEMEENKLFGHHHHDHNNKNNNKNNNKKHDQIDIVEHNLKNGDEKLNLINPSQVNKRECYGAVDSQTLI